MSASSTDKVIAQNSVGVGIADDEAGSHNIKLLACHHRISHSVRGAAEPCGSWLASDESGEINKELP